MNDSDNNDWVIVCSQSLSHYVRCICGHRVKRITYLYHKPSKAIQYVGKTCVRKYGIEISLTNPILLDVIKANLKKAEWDRDACVREHIQSQYTTFMTMALTDESSDISVNKVVGPFRRLLSDVCDLVSEYGFDLVDILRDIEREVESLNQATRHQMVDEYSLCDTISEIASEHTDVADEELAESVTESAEESVVESVEAAAALPITDDKVDIEATEGVHVTDDEVDIEVTEGVHVIEDYVDAAEYIPVVEEPVDEVISVVDEPEIYMVVESIIKSLEEPAEIQEPEEIQQPEEIQEPAVVIEEPVVESVMGRFLRTTTNIHPTDIELCSAKTHCYCAMKYRIRLLHEGIEELRINVEKTHKETQKLIQGSIKQRIKADEYLERSRKLYPDIFPQKNSDEKN